MYVIQFRGLYKGIGPPMLSFTMINSIVFGVHGSTLHYLQPTDDLTRPVMWKSAVAGGIAGAVQSFIAGPTELVRTRMMLQSIGVKSGPFYKNKPKQLYSNSLDCFIKIYRVGGVRGVFDGMVPTLFREIPSFATYFATYDYLCQKMMSDHDRTKHSLSMHKLMYAGGISGMVCWAVSYPFDVVKTMVQIDGMGQRQYSGMVDCFVKIYRAEGARVFFKGITPALTRAFPVNAATFAAHSLVIRNLKDL